MTDEDTQITKDVCSDLEDLLNRARAETSELAQSEDIPPLVTHFDRLRDAHDAIKERLTALYAEITNLSYEIIPTMFLNQGVKSIKIDGVGNVVVSHRWNASLIDKARAYDWLRANDAGGLIIETISAPTLAGFAKERMMEGKPLPQDLFRVGTAPYVSIRNT